MEEIFPSYLKRDRGSLNHSEAKIKEWEVAGSKMLPLLKELSA
jgi:hypothetical protein